MYFTRHLGNVYHILDGSTGSAPSPCGARLEKIALIHLRAGEPSRFLTAEKPAHIPLCKHCRKSQASPDNSSRPEGGRWEAKALMA
jgi:hypothetical protein